ncbi:transcription repressor OFP13-like [Carica papaya]|uniref:transcription repressor OFP13-like n=1 Tax=Carica papaya TaxID=3649 RepID=UPI000B8CC779|nr:transcription repressor OFP13-like [Carica papaya]
MGKKMKLRFLSSNPSISKPSWPWPSCHQPRTLSFRTTTPDAIFKTINSAYIDATIPAADTSTPDSWLFTNSSESASFSTAASDNESAPECIETVIRGLRSERLFFQPGETSSILEEAKPGGFPFKESSVLSMESQDPYEDFRTSMEEMVLAHGLKDWEGLEVLLCWYLRVNGKSNHGYIVGAFVDLLVGLSLASATTCSFSRDSPSSSLSFYTSSSSSDDSSSTPCVSSMEAHDHDEIISSNNTACISSLLEADDEIKESKDDDDDVDDPR